MLDRILFLFLAGFMGLLVACAPQSSAIEALYRHQIRSDAGGQQDVALICLGTGSNSQQLADPSDSVLARFRGHRPPVKGVSACRWTDTHWTDRATGGRAIVHYIAEISCRSPLHCTARGGYLQGNLSASGNRYVLERKKDGWQVTSDRMEWIS